MPRFTSSNSDILITPAIRKALGIFDQRSWSDLIPVSICAAISGSVLTLVVGALVQC